MKEIFTKLMAIRSVANNNYGLSNNFAIVRSLLLSLSRQAARSSAEREKKATSDPANKAERSSKPTRTKALIP